MYRFKGDIYNCTILHIKKISLSQHLSKSIQLSMYNVIYNSRYILVYHTLFMFTKPL